MLNIPTTCNNGLHKLLLWVFILEHVHIEISTYLPIERNTYVHKYFRAAHCGNYLSLPMWGI